MRSLSITAALAAATLAHHATAQWDPQLPGSLQPVTTFTLPAGAFDLLGGGRLLSIAPNGDVLLQTAPNASDYTIVNSIDAPNSQGFGASFLSVSPSSNYVAIGNNEFNASNAVNVFDTTSLLLGGGSTTPIRTFVTPNFAGDWSADEQSIYVSGAMSSSFTPVVNRLDFSFGSNTVDTVISPAGVFSGGLAIDGTTLLVGDGNSGDVRAFDTATLPASPVPFTAGDFIASSTSASTIDTLGDLLLIAGQNFGGQGSALVIDRAQGTSIRLQPAGPDAFYGGYFNHATNQLVVTANGTAYVYAIPAPATLALAPLAVFATRRRRA